MKLAEKGVQTVNLLFLFDVCVVLGNTPKGELLHEIDFVWLVEVLVLEVLHNDGEGCREQEYLAVSWAKGNGLFNDGLEFRREKLVGFVHDNSSTFGKVSNTFSS